MTLTVRSVFIPLQDLLLTRFADDRSHPGRFRFAEQGALTVHSGADRHDPLVRFEGQPCREQLSAVADRMPVDVGDGVHALLTRGSIARYYQERLVDLAQPRWAPGVDDLTRIDVSTAFEKVLADARDHLSVSVPLDGNSAPPSFPVRWEPGGWRDPTKHAAWVTHAFIAADPPDVAGPTVCWRFGGDGSGVREAAVITSQVEVSFECCPVWLHRDWMSWLFLNSPAWCVPGSGAGPAAASHDTGRYLLVGFVAVRNLELRANWSAADLEALASATSWGPFALTPPPPGRAVATYAGVQIVGWVLGSMPVRARNIVSMRPT